MLILERNHQNDDKKLRALTMTVTFMRGGCHIKSQLARLVFWTCIAWLSPLSPLPTTDHSRLLRQDGDNDQNNNVDNDEASKIWSQYDQDNEEDLHESAFAQGWLWKCPRVPTGDHRHQYKVHRTLLLQLFGRAAQHMSTLKWWRWQFYMFPR